MWQAARGRAPPRKSPFSQHAAFPRHATPNSPVLPAAPCHFPGTNVPSFAPSGAPRRPGHRPCGPLAAAPRPPLWRRAALRLLKQLHSVSPAALALQLLHRRKAGHCTRRGPVSASPAGLFESGWVSFFSCARGSGPMGPARRATQSTGSQRRQGGTVGGGKLGARPVVGLTARGATARGAACGALLQQGRCASAHKR